MDSGWAAFPSTIPTKIRTIREGGASGGVSLIGAEENEPRSGRRAKPRWSNATLWNCLLIVFRESHITINRAMNRNPLLRSPIILATFITSSLLADDSEKKFHYYRRQSECSRSGVRLLGPTGMTLSAAISAAGGSSFEPVCALYVEPNASVLFHTK
jgi:hypothetical protein